MKQDLIRAYDMLPDCGVVLCAVSGGADSMCLLAWMQELSSNYGFSVAAAHYHHGLRGDAADRDEEFVREYCAAQQIPFYAGHGDVRAAAQKNDWSLEEAGRNLRYAFLEKTAEQISAVRIATAHHRGDNAETVLMNLIRGTGLTGLSGIQPVRGIFIRPLLDTSREEIEGYLHQRKIDFVEDETNQELVYTRNRIRHEILPLLRELNPRVEEALNNTAQLLRQDDAYLSKMAERVCQSVQRNEGYVSLERTVLADLPTALQSRVVRHMFDLLRASKKDVTARHIQAVLELVQKSGPTAQLSLPRGIIARNVYEMFRLYAPTQHTLERRTLLPVGEVEAGGWHVRCCVTEDAPEEKRDRLILNNDAIDEPVYIDRWQPQDRMTLPGQEGSRSLKRLFVDAGISVKEREETPVIYVGSRAAAVLGIGVDRKFEPNEQALKYVLDFEKR